MKRHAFIAAVGSAAAMAIAFIGQVHARPDALSGSDLTRRGRG